MASNDFKQNLKEEILFYQNALYCLIWQIIAWVFWLGLVFLAAFLLLGEKTIWLGLIVIFFLLSQIKPLFKSQKSFDDSSIPNNLWELITPQTKKILIEAGLHSLENNIPPDLSFLKSLLKDKTVKEVFKKLNIEQSALKKEMKNSLNSDYKTSSNIENVLEYAQNIVEDAFYKAKIIGLNSITPLALFLSLLEKEEKETANALLHLGLTLKEVESTAQILVFEKKISPSLLKQISFGFASLGLKKRHIKHRIMNRAWTARPTPFLDRFSIDITDLARSGLVGFMVNRQKEYDRLTDILSRDFQNNALLVGKEGVGKETLINHLALNIINDQVPKKLFDKRIVKLNLAALLTGTQTEGEVRARGQRVISEILRAKNVILYIPNLEEIFSNTEISLLSSVFLPYFKESYFQVIGSTSFEGFKELEKEIDFLNTFEKIEVPELSEDNTLQVITLYGLLLEKKYKILITPQALRKIIKLAKVYSPQKVYPRVAIELLGESVKEALDRKLKKLLPDLIEEIVERKTSIPLKKVSQIEAQKLLNLEKEIHTSLIDQDQAVEAVADVLRSYRAGLKANKGPIASFLFVGPTGVGKTQLSKTLAKILFGSEDQMIRFDMSKYRDPLSIWKFIGSPDGKETGELAEAILRKPYSIVLLDEFEKATTEILNLFLPILDEGKIKDNMERTLDFTNSLIIATSNAHSEYIFEALNKNEPFDKIALELKNLLVKDYPPELLNRFNEVIIFKPLNMEDVKKIAILLLKPIEKELSNKYNYQLKITQTALNQLVEKGYSKEFGARPLKHTIEREVRDLLAKEILENQWPPRTKLVFDWQNDRFCVKIA